MGRKLPTILGSVLVTATVAWSSQTADNSKTYGPFFEVYAQVVLVTPDLPEYKSNALEGPDVPFQGVHTG